MTAETPITQDVQTIPRKLPEGPVNIVGLTRDKLRKLLIENGTPEKQAKMRTGQIWQWVYQWASILDLQFWLKFSLWIIHSFSNWLFP